MKIKKGKNIFIVFVTYFTINTVLVYEIRKSHQIVINQLYGKTVKNLQRTMFYSGRFLS